MYKTLTVALALLLVVLSGFGLVFLLRILGRPNERDKRARLLHDLSDSLYILVYVALIASLILNVAPREKVDAIDTLRLALIVAAAPIVPVKLVIARSYPALHRVLPPLGITAFVVSLFLASLSTAPTILKEARAATIRSALVASLPSDELVELGELLVNEHCQSCHTLDRVFNQKGRRSAELWEAILDRMIEKDEDLGQYRDAMLAFLQTKLAAPQDAAGRLMSGVSLVQARCSACHSLDRVFEPTKTERGWRLTVRRYGSLLPGHIRPEEIEPIVAFLFSRRAAPPDPRAGARETFEEHCAKCHNLSRPLRIARARKLEPADWGKVIERMAEFAKERKVTGWNASEAKSIAGFLSDEFDAARAVHGHDADP